MTYTKGGMDLACVTDNGKELAKFEKTLFTHKKVGKMEIVDQTLAPGVVDELMATGLASAERERRKARAAASGAGVAGASSTGSAGGGGC